MRDLSGYLYYRFPSGRETAGQWKTTCPVCLHPNNKCFIDINSGKAFCHHCNWKAGTWYWMIADLEGLKSRDEVSRWLRDHETIFQDIVYGGSRTPDERTPMRPQLFKEFVEIEEGDPFHDYLVGRRIDVELGRSHGFKKCLVGKYKFRLIMPVYEQGRLVFFHDRTIDPTCTNRIIGIGTSTEFWPIPKADCIWNLDSIRQNGTVRITEGIFSAISLDPMNTVALLGKTCSKSQLNKILAKRPMQVEVCLDPGTEDLAIKLANEFTSRGIVTWIRFLDYGDPNDYAMKGDALPEPVLWSKPAEVLYRLDKKKYVVGIR